MVYYFFLLSHNFPISFSTWILDIEVAHQIFSPCNNVSLSQNEIWLYRLGHPSYVTLQTLKDEIEVKPNSGDSSHCLVFHLVKQCKLHFISHNYLSVLPFQLIHCDV